MIDYSEEVARIEAERSGNQWRRAEDYASLASRVREERDETKAELDALAGRWVRDLQETGNYQPDEPLGHAIGRCCAALGAIKEIIAACDSSDSQGERTRNVGVLDDVSRQQLSDTIRDICKKAQL
jgi:hypothetical protein